jgi:hypothetical protein
MVRTQYPVLSGLLAAFGLADSDLDKGNYEGDANPTAISQEAKEKAILIVLTRRGATDALNCDAKERWMG